MDLISWQSHELRAAHSQAVLARAARWLRRGMVFWLAVAALCAAATVGAYFLASASHLSTLRQTNTQRLEFFATTRESPLHKYEYLPFMLSLERDVALLLREPGN